MRIGVDLGGTKIEAIALDRDGQQKFRERVETPRGDYEQTITAIRALVEKAESTLGEKATVGVGTPGAISPATGRIKNSNSVWLIDKPLDRDLGTALNREVRLANDANCFALSEAVDGAAQGAKSVFGVILGTGVGGGIILDQRVLEGHMAIAGEWGHNPLPWPTKDEIPGPECYCKLHGCIETFLSGKGLELDYKIHNGEILSGAEIGEAAKTQKAAEDCFLRYENRLARALSAVINLLDPDVIVLGGGVSNNDRLYQSVPKIWNEFVFSDVVETRLCKNLHGDSGGVRGAAWLWPKSP